MCAMCAMNAVRNSCCDSEMRLNRILVLLLLRTSLFYAIKVLVFGLLQKEIDFFFDFVFVFRREKDQKGIFRKRIQCVWRCCCFRCRHFLLVSCLVSAIVHKCSFFAIGYCSGRLIDELHWFSAHQSQYNGSNESYKTTIFFTQITLRKNEF